MRNSVGRAQRNVRNCFESLVMSNCTRHAHNTDRKDVPSSAVGPKKPTTTPVIKGFPRWMDVKNLYFKFLTSPAVPFQHNGDIKRPLRHVVTDRQRQRLSFITKRR